MIFLDGVGLGEKNPEKNIFFRGQVKFFETLFGDIPHLHNRYLSSGGRYLFPVDATMGVEGLPQSGTGQTSIFCGVNAPKIIGRHFGPYPHSELMPVLRKENIFREMKELNREVAFANAYPKIFFDYINSGRKRLSVTSLSCMLSDVRLRSSTDLRKGKALSAEIDNSRWIEKLNYNLSRIRPETAARRLLKLASGHDFTLFEYFLTDHIGHWRINDFADHALGVLDRFLIYLFENLPNDFTLIVCSDHGNIEDMSVKHHTPYPALGITSGKFADSLAGKIKSLYDIKESIVNLYK
jgi:hypothetical protein